MPDNDDTSAIDKLSAKLDAILGKLPKVNDDPPDVDKPVPYSRFYQASQRAEAAEAALVELTGELDEIKTSFASKLTEMEAGHTTALEQLQVTHAEDVSLIEAGLDADGRDVLRSTWGRLDEGERGESPAAWWASQVEAAQAHREDPSQPAPALPKPLTPYLPEGEPAPADTPDNGKPATAGPRSVIVGRGLTAQDRGIVTGPKESPADKIRAAAAAGDWGAMRAAMQEADGSS